MCAIVNGKILCSCVVTGFEGAHLEVLRAYCIQVSILKGMEDHI